ncbi:MAG: hypothetical protein CBARDCOR_3976 [uncultured Caballeronia sp.]|nr:MAG: hypothetical protein CBARDCOR_3976 [uncultured Caballeronia sp.]
MRGLWKPGYAACRMGATPIDEKIVATQQNVADMFYRAKLIPKAVTVKDNVWRDQDALTAR